jgi:hypothetical protein
MPINVDKKIPMATKNLQREKNEHNNTEREKKVNDVLMIATHRPTGTDGRDFTDIGWDHHGAQTTGETTDDSAGNKHPWDQRHTNQGTTHDKANVTEDDGFFPSQLGLEECTHERADQPT